jgi:hypothetical protein
MSNAARAGTNVRDNTNADARASINVITMGENILPSTPWKVRHGTKTRKITIWP